MTADTYAFLRIVRLRGIAPRIMALVATGIVALGAAVILLNTYLLFDNANNTARERVEANMKVAWDVLRQKGAPFHVVNGRLLAGDYEINDSAEVVDKVKALVGGTCTVFMGDMRVATNVIRPDGRRAVGTTLAKTAAYASVLGNRQPFRGEVDILGEPYMTAYDPIFDETGKVIGILYVGLKKSEFTSAAVAALWTTLAATFGVAVVALAVGYLLVNRGIATPLKEAITVMGLLAKGDLAVAIPARHGVDEIEAMCRALGVFKANAVERQKLAAEQQADQEARNRRQAAMEQLTRDFNQGVRGVLGTVTGSAHQLREAARAMSTVAEETLHQTNVVVAAAEQASANVETVAAAAEELAASENEIARQVERSSEVARLAANKADQVNQTVTSLSAATSRIGDVITLINRIAAQTNLLALNATIEAARAGDAGKGFAVVANEVKGLANQTARATEEITGQIGAIQAVTKDAVEAIVEINETIGTISENITTIAAAVEQQTAATREIARNVMQASSKTREVTHSISLVKDGAATSGTSAHQVLATADSLSEQSNGLAAEVADFLSAIKTAGDRRQYERIEARMPVTVQMNGQRLGATLHDVSLGGACVQPAFDGPIGNAVVLEIQGWTGIRGRIIGNEENHTRIQFALDPATQQQVKAGLSRIAA